MKLIYIANMRMPTEKAHGVHIAKMCEAFGRLGADIELVVPRRRNTNIEDPYRYYGIEHTFPIRYVFSIDLIRYAFWLGFWVQTLSFTIAAAFRFLFRSRKDIIIYTREHLIAVAFHMLGFETVYEAHRVLLKKRLFFSLLRGIQRIVTNSEGVASEFRAHGFQHVLALPNGVDPREFDFPDSRQELRSRLSVSDDARLIVYTGHLYAWKGIDTVLAAATELASDTRYRFLMVGGTREDVEAYRSRVHAFGLGNIEFLGHVPKRDVARYLKAADVLLLPNSAISEESIKYTSPMKMFEYMASGVPLVASDMPSIREILNEKNALLVPPDSSAALAAGVTRIFSDESAAHDRAAQARTDVRDYTWEKRAEKILSFIGLSSQAR